MPVIKRPAKLRSFLMATAMIRFLAVAGLLAGNCVHVHAAEPPNEKYVRVAIARDIDELNFSVRGKYEILDLRFGTVLVGGRSLPGSRLSSHPGGIKINDEEYPLRKIRVTSTKDITLYPGDKVQRYRGTLDIIQKSNKKFLVVNTVELEQYVRGVLYREVSHRWPMEAMKAQAVAARTYALYQMKKNKNDEYDVTGDIYSQVYGGKNAERFRTNIAVKRTAGEILAYNDKVLPAYFHASCGGHTENARNIWGEDLPPLAGVPCSFCAFAPHATWKRNFRSQDIQDKLSASGFPIGPIADIRVMSRNHSGRINNLQFSARDGKTTLIPGIRFRAIIGPNIIKSNNYEVTMKGYYFDLVGKGWGHGVGMCQWGAHQMAEERRKYDEILSFYYPGAKIVDYREQPPVDLP